MIRKVDGYRGLSRKGTNLGVPAERSRKRREVSDRWSFTCREKGTGKQAGSCLLRETGRSTKVPSDETIPSPVARGCELCHTEMW